MYFLGGDVDDQFYTVTDGNYGIAIAGILEDRQYMCFTETSDLPTFRSIAAMNPTSRSAKAMRKAASRGGMIAGENLTRKF